MDTLCKALIVVPLLSGLAACGESIAPAPASNRASVSTQGPLAAYPTVALGSGTGTSRDLHEAADFVPDGELTPALERHRGSGAFGVGIRPGHSASGIRP